MTDNSEIANKITQLFDERQLEIQDRLEIIANVLIQDGLMTLPEEVLPDEITPENLMEVVLKLNEHYEETLGMAMVHQGLVLLMWLES